IDTEAGIIVDVEATPAHRSLEVQSTKTMIERVENRFAMKTKKLIGDTARPVHQRDGVVPKYPIEKSPEAFMKLHGM
ncbi:MAG: hypothetical protein DRQ98_13640, partial [Gammaproteobacteria bacterium]